jgi:TolB-like protein/class 3 adenylate cyclase/Tfp pilus assembly protein PilF
MAAEVKKEIQLEIAHVLFTDIAGYSKLPINQQRALVERLNEIVQGTEEFQSAEAAGRLIKIPTGDGITLVFYQSPEAPVECALEISRALKKHPELQLRMGIHSGPVSGVIDVTGKANVAGAGINMAQRVMDCGDAGHILLSKRLAEDLEQYPHWKPHLHELGECEVKHGMRISVVNLYTEELGNPAIPEKLKTARLAEAAQRKWAAFRRLLLGVVALLVAIIAIGFLLSRYKRTRTAVESAVPDKSIAVLPFENLSEDKANAYFAEGIQDEILTRLSKIADLKVISRTSTQHYKSAPENLPEIARQLGVAHILEGRVQKSGDAVRVNVQLIKAYNDSHLWADTFDRKLTDIFAVESEIAKTIAETLRAKLTASEERAVAVRPTENPEAYQLYLKGRFFWNKRTTADLKKSIDYFNQAIEQDPNYALAYAGLADAWLVLPVFGGGAPKDCSPKAEMAARRAIQLDETLGEPHASLGLLLAIYYFDFSSSIRELERAIQLNPNYAMAHHWLGNLPLTFTGQFDRAIGELKRALDLDPLSMIINTNLGQTYCYSRRYEEAIAQLHRTIEIDPTFYYAHYQLGEALELKGNGAAAIAEYQKARELNDDPLVQALLAQAMAKYGNPAQARKVLEQLKEESSHRYVTAYGIGLIHLGLGEKEQALRSFEKSYEDRDGTEIGYVKVNPLLDSLRGDPHFEALVEKVLAAKTEPTK